jgi:hypothetical protein
MPGTKGQQHYHKHVANVEARYKGHGDRDTAPEYGGANW